MTEAEIASWVEMMNPDLLLQLQRSGVTARTIAALAKNRFTTVAKYQMMGNDPDKVEKVAKVMGLDDEDNIDMISDITGLKTAWAACRQFQQAEDQQRAETKVLGLITPMKKSEYTNMRLAFEKAHSVQEEKRLPGQSILDAIEAGLEEGEHRPPRLVELPSLHETKAATQGRTDTLGFTMSLNMSGAIKVNQPVKVKLNMPSDGCEFRDRIRLLWAAYEFMKIRHPMDATLRSSSREIWEEHIDYILGDKVKGRAMTGLDGTVKKSPSWQLIMHYEMKIREKAAKLINESHLSGGERYNLATALKAARACRDTRDEEFEDKFRLQQDPPKTKNKARGSNDRSPSVSPPTKRGRKSDKGKGKGRGRGSSRDAKDRNNRPPSKFDNKTLHREKGGKAICYPFNNKGGCRRKACTMLHVCQFCLSDGHGLLDCPSK